MSPPQPYWSDGQVTLHLGDCLDVMRAMPDASVDAVVTDPPSGISFMGREWDGSRGGRDRWIAWLAERMAEACRVLKPGGHALVWSLPRTSGWTQMALEDAGFEVRDCIVHIFGTGYPKSLDVSKAIDRRAEENVETQRRIAAVAEVIRSHREAAGMTPQQVSLAVVGTPSGACWNWENHQLPSAETWPSIKRALCIPDIFDSLIEGDRARFIAAERAVVGVRTTGIGTGRGATPFISDSPNRDLTAPATESAARWEGWGTALKPGQEMWWLVRKPLAGTVAGTVLEHGTGALNIAACRVEGGPRPARTNEASASGLTGTGGAATYGSYAVRGSIAIGETTEGRWPANVVFTHSALCGDNGCEPDCPVGELDRQSGVLTSGANPARRGSDKFRDAYGDFAGQQDCVVHRGADSGGASRFFHAFRYQAKAPSSERPRGEDGSAHVTVKSLGLMRHFVRLVTPPGGTVLDPFCGSGASGEAAVIEGFNCILIDDDPQSANLAKLRLTKPIQPTMFGIPA